MATRLRSADSRDFSLDLAGSGWGNGRSVATSKRRVFFTLISKPIKYFGTPKGRIRMGGKKMKRNRVKREEEAWRKTGKKIS